MARYQAGAKKARVPRRIWWLLTAIIVLSIAGMVIVRHVYDDYLKPVSSNQTSQIFTVKKDSSVKQIADNLQDARLIRSSWAFQLYVQRKELGDKLQAGTYALSPDKGTAEIVSIMTKGTVTRSRVTIYPGERVDEIRADFINSGFSPSSVDKALTDVSQYSDAPVMSFKPSNVATLEGLLWPDTFFKNPSTDPAYIIRQSLDAMGQHLTSDVQAAFAAQGLTTYQGITLASIIIQEVNKPGDQGQAAQVFLSRLKSGSVLGSDVTASYGSIAAGRASSDLNYDSPYNTHLHPGLPPTPISTINASSLAAATHPAGTSWLYFVTGDDGVTHFSANLQDHEAATEKYCHKLCGR